MLTLTESLLALCVATELLDPFARPRRGGRWRPRSLVALPFRLGPALFVFGVALCLVGRPAGAGLIATILLVAVVAGSDIKRRILGEPLLFTDAAVLGEMLRHPGFYLGAIAPAARLALVVVLGVVGWLLLRGWTGVLLPRLAGAGLALCCWPVLDRLALLGPWRRLMTVPAVETDVALHGLLATVSLYWLRWRRQPDPLPVPAAAGHGSGVDGLLVLVVQCESFADPRALSQAVASRAPPLPGLARARARAVRSGQLAACGFGAYTMRTEYGVLFGREEDDLGFRRFDPFLTAMRDRSTALPTRLRGRVGTALFVHPHDLGFYGRDRLMPAIGFTDLIGLDAFPGAARRGPHVADAALGDRLEALIGADASALIYAVTIENHGPWKAGRLHPGGSGLDAYLDHLAAGDALLARLIDLLDARGRPALLAFFGDHRPSISGAVEPGGDRDTPFVLLRFGEGADGEASRARAPERLTPAGLHHAILQEAAAFPA